MEAVLSEGGFNISVNLLRPIYCPPWSIDLVSFLPGTVTEVVPALNGGGIFVMIVFILFHNFLFLNIRIHALSYLVSDNRCSCRHDKRTRNLPTHNDSSLRSSVVEIFRKKGEVPLQ